DVLMQDKKTLVTEQSVLKSAQAEWETERQQLISSIDVTSAGVASVQPGIAAPEIQIIDPPITLTRSGASVLLTESVPKIEIVGKITSPIGIKTARINNLPLTTDEFDLFFASIPVQGVRTEVHIVAHDKQNNQSRFDFVLFNDEGQIRPENASFQARPAKKQNTLAPKLGVDFGEYHALVIGNNEYQHFPKLNTAVNDARAVARVLRQQYGFNVTLLVNARRYDILAALDRLRRSLTERDNLLIYYAGHGELEETSHEGYWLGVDAAPIFASNWLSNLTLSDQLNTFKADQIMVVADSCYAGTFSTASIARSAVQIKNSAYQNWLEVMVDVRARTVLTSGGTRPVLDSLGGEHSLFAQAFIDVLENNHTIIDGNSIYINILNAMSKHNQPGQYRQVPDYGAIKFAGHEAGEFFLTPKTL
ncbi:MAG: caspase family protein, partial [Pseudomonadales bacterium]|nr:caspase family protein [Pseudomonadales bacterium]